MNALDGIDRTRLASEMAEYFDRLWPLMRSITGSGVRQTHDILSEILPLKRIEVPSGTKVFDWTVPREWVFREAYVIDPNGNRILDAAENTLHVLNYSTPFRGHVSRCELDKHLYSLPERPNAIPYLTTYYEERWGFCLSQCQRDSLPEGDYEVVVDSDLIDGFMTLSDAVLPGETSDEILFSTYTCHPSLANNELSGPLVTAFLYRFLAAVPRRRYTYRFVFCPETIGSIAYLSEHGEYLANNLRAGYVITCVGTEGPFTYKRSRRGNALADRAAIHATRQTGGDGLEIIDFDPSAGSDERQYCSPGFNLPVGSLMRAMYGTYPEYHTSLDDQDVVSFDAMVESAIVYYEICRTIELNRSYMNLVSKCEPQLGKRGLYPSVGGRTGKVEQVMSTLWVLNYSDGQHDLLDIAEKSGLDIRRLAEAADKAERAGLMERLP